MGGSARIPPDEIIALTEELVAFDTSNPPGNEELAIHALGAYLEAAGLAVSYQHVGEQRANLIARLPGRSRSGGLVFSGHMDVVPARENGWKTPPFTAIRRGGRLYGRGTADMKGGIAAMAVALATLARDHFTPSSDLTMAVTSGEEQGMPGAQIVSSSRVLEGCAAMVIGEPTGLNLCSAEKGYLNWSIQVHGKAAHSSQPHLGVNAISFMAQLIVAIDKATFTFTPHPVLQKPTVTVTLIQGGVVFNVVPPLCTAWINVRNLPGQTQESWETELRPLIDSTISASQMPVQVDLTFASGGPVIETPLDHPLVRAAHEAVVAIQGREPAVEGFTGGTEAKIYFPAYRVPTIIVGPGHLEMAHQTNEYVDIDELIAAASIYRELALRLLSDHSQ